MTYWGKHHDANFWIENASVEWKEAEAPFHNVARLTLLRGSHLGPDEAKAVYFDVTGIRHPTARPLAASIAPALRRGSQQKGTPGSNSTSMKLPLSIEHSLLYSQKSPIESQIQ